ncbi:MAG TPA: hypothetical protein VGE97_00355 [Nitrososphaera sp.]|jgi:hypothetical protein
MKLTEEAWKEQLDILFKQISDYRVAMIQAEKHPSEQQHHFTVSSLMLQKIETLLQSLPQCNPYELSQEQEQKQDRFAFTDWIDGYALLDTDVRTCEGYIFFAYMRGNSPNRKDFLRATYATLTRMLLYTLCLIELQKNNTIFSQEDEADLSMLVIDQSNASV